MKNQIKSSTPSGHFKICSRSAFEDYIQLSPQKIKSVKCSSEEFNKVCHIVQESGNNPEIVEIGWAGRDSHIEFTAIVNSLSEEEFFTCDKSLQSSCVLVLDEISDPRNLGAIARTAAFFGIHHIIVKQDRQVLLTDTVVSTAQGGFATVNLTVVVNLARFLKRLKTEGFWIIGTDVHGEPMQNLKGFYDKVAIVLGSEGKGIGKRIKGSCDRIMTVKGHSKGVQSLNVSVACGIIANEFTT